MVTMGLLSGKPLKVNIENGNPYYFDFEKGLIILQEKG
jgi:hypothetical protein